MVFGKGHEDDGEAARIAAATLIQRMWRGRKNKAKDDHLTTSMRWDDATTQTRLMVNRNAALDGENSPLKRWKRAAFFVGQLGDKNEILKGEGIHADAQNKVLETQHWLELIDGKHRYGSNLKFYHRVWQAEDTTENFFKWLDHGGGKNLSLDECPRQQLESERILYLSAEQRLNYLVKINDAGKLYWAKNNQLVDTTAGNWKDAGDGQGIIPQNMPSTGPWFGKGASGPIPLATGRRDSDADLNDQMRAATHYAGVPKGRYKWSRYLRQHFTPRGMMQRLLQKTLKRNTWIYVTDKKFNIFIGIKETGAFQHSSFTSGGTVTSAGLISVKQGVIHTLSPLSGHYRTTVNHFHRFIEVLTERGVDMHKVRISKAEAALWGIEKLQKYKKARSHALSKGKKTVANMERDVKATLAPKSDSLDTDKWKIDILTGRKSPTQRRASNGNGAISESNPVPVLS